MPSNVFDGSEGGIISETTSDSYRQEYESSSQFVLNQGIKGHFFGKVILEDLLNQTGAKGLRIYYGLKPISGSPSQPQLIIMAVDSDGNDILTNDKIADVSQPCPPLCNSTQSND